VVSGKDEGPVAETGGRSPGFLKQILRHDGSSAETSRKQEKGGNVAHVPSTVLTVEYVDGSEGMEATLRALDERLKKLEKLSGEMQQTTTQLVAVVNQQARELAQFIESLNRRVDKVYREVCRHGPPGGAAVEAAAEPERNFEVPAQFAANPEHQKAWRVARVMAGDLEAYHGDTVKEGVLYDSFYELLKDPIAEARRTYDERVPQAVSGKFDYLDLALKELIARKKKELAAEAAPQ